MLYIYIYKDGKKKKISISKECNDVNALFCSLFLSIPILCKRSLELISIKIEYV
jgi:hypothetical protein